jgi:uncharacterized protein (DUF58 family)
MEVMTIILFLLALAACVITGASILYALLAGYVIFFAYGLWKNFRPRVIAHDLERHLHSKKYSHRLSADRYD